MYTEHIRKSQTHYSTVNIFGFSTYGKTPYNTTKHMSSGMHCSRSFIQTSFVEGEEFPPEIPNSSVIKQGSGFYYVFLFSQNVQF